MIGGRDCNSRIRIVPYILHSIKNSAEAYEGPIVWRAGHIVQVAELEDVATAITLKKHAILKILWEVLRCTPSGRSKKLTCIGAYLSSANQGVQIHRGLGYRAAVLVVVCRLRDELV